MTSGSDAVGLSSPQLMRAWSPRHIAMSDLTDEVRANRATCERWFGHP
jgi:hypothetical protein